MKIVFVFCLPGWPYIFNRYQWRSSGQTGFISNRCSKYSSRHPCALWTLKLHNNYPHFSGAPLLKCLSTSGLSKIAWWQPWELASRVNNAIYTLRWQELLSSANEGDSILNCFQPNIMQKSRAGQYKRYSVSSGVSIRHCSRLTGSYGNHH